MLAKFTQPPPRLRVDTFPFHAGLPAQLQHNAVCGSRFAKNRISRGHKLRAQPASRSRGGDSRQTPGMVDGVSRDQGKLRDPEWSCCPRHGYNFVAVALTLAAWPAFDAMQIVQWRGSRRVASRHVASPRGDCRNESCRSDRPARTACRRTLTGFPPLGAGLGGAWFVARGSRVLT